MLRLILNDLALLLIGGLIALLIISFIIGGDRP